MNSQAEEVIILDIIIANWGSLYFTSGVLHVEEAKFLWQLFVHNYMTISVVYLYICGTCICKQNMHFFFFSFSIKLFLMLKRYKHK